MSDNAVFVDPNKFEEKLDDQPYTPEKNPLQLSKREKSYELIEKKTSAKNARNDSDLALSFVPDHMNFLDNEPGLLT